MGQTNSVSLTISEEDLTAINKAVELLQKKLLPLLTQIPKEKKKDMLIMGDKSVAFVTKAYEHAEQNELLIPNFLKMDEFEKDLNAINILRRLKNPLGHLAQMLDDTMIIAGSEAYEAARIFYNAVKLASDSNVANSKSIYEDLKIRFVTKKGQTIEEGGTE